MHFHAFMWVTKMETRSLAWQTNYNADPDPGPSQTPFGAWIRTMFNKIFNTNFTNVIIVKNFHTVYIFLAFSSFLCCLVLPSYKIFLDVKWILCHWPIFNSYAKREPMYVHCTSIIIIHCKMGTLYRFVWTQDHSELFLRAFVSLLSEGWGSRPDCIPPCRSQRKRNWLEP